MAELLTPAPCATRSTCITVSGYPPLPALAYVVEGRLLAAASLGAAVPWVAKRPRVHWTRCGRCRRIHRSDAPVDLRLGWRGWCGACVEVLVGECRRRNRRLPRDGELYCPVCRGIVPEALRGPMHSQTGHREHVCLPCYRAAARMRRRRLVASRRAVR